MISVVIPTLNAAESLAASLSALVPAAVNNLVREVVIADGGSTDETLAIAEDAGAKVVAAEPGRGLQFAAGCAAAKGPWLLALHPETRLGPEWEAAARDHMENHPREAGYFRFAVDDHRAAARLLEAGETLRCGVFGRPRGAQGLLISRRLYDEVGGYPCVSRAEDAVLARRLRGRLRPLAARAFVGARAV